MSSCIVAFLQPDLAWLLFYLFSPLKRLFYFAYNNIVYELFAYKLLLLPLLPLLAYTTAAALIITCFIIIFCPAYQ